MPLIDADAMPQLQPQSRARTVYAAFGLRLSSEIPLPELPVSPNEADGRSASDVVIARADPDALWDELRRGGNNFVRLDDRFLFLIPETAIYCIEEDGARVTVAPLAGSDMKKVRVYLLGTCMGALLMLRSMLPLHGSAVVIGGRAYAFLGDSGVGKSTLAAALVHRGYPLVSDDVIATTAGTTESEGMPLAMPAYPQQKLWQASIDGLGLAAGRYRPVYRETEKFAVPLPEPAKFSATPVPLAGIIELAKAAPGTDTAALRLLSPLERLKTIQLHTYRNMLIRRLGLEQWHFQTSAHIAARVRMYRLSRPTEGFTAQRLASAIIRIATKENR